MVGGKVIEVIVCQDRVWVNCEDKRDQCAIYVKRDSASLQIKPGDKLWWQSSWAMWTPEEYAQESGKCGKDYDIKLERIGFSGVNRPGADRQVELPINEATPEGHLAVEAICVHKCLDEQDVDRFDGKERLSLWGRVLLFAKEQK